MIAFFFFFLRFDSQGRSGLSFFFSSRDALAGRPSLPGMKSDDPGPVFVFLFRLVEGVGLLCRTWSFPLFSCRIDGVFGGTSLFFCRSQKKDRPSCLSIQPRFGGSYEAFSPPSTIHFLFFFFFLHCVESLPPLFLLFPRHSGSTVIPFLARRVDGVLPFFR